MRCYGCGYRGHYRNKCLAKAKGEPAETPGKDQRGNGPGHMANLAPEEPDAREPEGDGDGVKEALERAIATMHTISSRPVGTAQRWVQSPWQRWSWRESL